jgi:hypothetical protein
MKVVCQACHQHYGYVEGTFAEMLVLQDALAVYHTAHCKAPRSETAAAAGLLRSITAIEVPS